ncbi:hypothetical protein F4801DRAFT_214050 [Xylaria longipes]|nr:hypothetical protein F4801DRAFT_214050 [Xylaria longipes]RYC65048.1 hypothetical protein CHU98_g1175 [Xylaria longipes]
MAADAPNALFQSIADAATATWYAHRASTPSSKQSPSIRHDSTQAQALTPMPPPPAAATPVASASPVPSPAHPRATEGLVSGTSPAASPTPSPTSSRGDSEVQVSRDASIRSDITAWQSTLQVLPPEFANSELPLHPLAQALSGQPTLRAVEWNQYRQQGGFVPRTPHDFSSLMIYLSGQVNPNPCRNCLLRNGPFARCVVSPPAVLAVSTIRHACANCTYQNQYKKCTNEPISEQEKMRSEISRPSSMARPRSTVPRKPKSNVRTNDRKELGLEQILQERLLPKPNNAKERRRHERLKKRLQIQQQEQPENRGDVSVTEARGGLGLGNNSLSFDEKLRHIRASSPRSRRRIAAETLQWQAAIATVEAEKSAPAPDLSIQTSINSVTPNNHFQASFNNYTASQPVSTTPLAFARHTPARDYSTRPETTSYDAENTAEPMDEDESDDDHEDEYEGAQWVGPNHTGPMIKGNRL